MTDFVPDPDEVAPPKMDWDKPSKAIIAAQGGQGVVWFTAGPHVDSFMNEGGSRALDDLGLDDAPDGLSVWEGSIRAVHYNTPDCNEHDAWLEGEFRDLTDDEWQAVRENRCPWLDEDWHL